MHIVGIVQARMGSTRLPGKVLRNIVGSTMLAHVLQCVKQAALIDEVLVATTVESADEAIVVECKHLGVPVFRGDEQDVLDRYYRAAQICQAEVIVRITSDCPLIDPETIDHVTREFLTSRCLDYASNTLSPRTFPRGLDVEVILFDALERAWREDDNPAWREHVTPYIYRHPEKFKLHAVANDVDYSHMRWTVDTAEDLDFVRRIYDHFGHARFSWHEVLTVLEQHPEWMELNRHVQQKVT